MSDTRTYIRLHDGMPDHPKVDGLSDKAFRLLVESWCWCSRHLTDGHMPAATWRKRATAKARRELVDAGLVIVLDDGSVRFHDYLAHQRSAAEVAELKAARTQGGGYGAHKRWHLARGIVHPGCVHCRSNSHGSTYRSSHGSTYGSTHDEKWSQNGNSDPGKRVLTRESSDEESRDVSAGGDNPTSGNAIAPPMGHAWVSDSKPMTSTETETEGTTFGSSSSGSVSRSSSSSRRAREHENDEELDRAIAGLVEQHTGRPCPPGHAAEVRALILDGRDVERPLPYVIRAIRDNPARFMPPEPPTPPRPEPWMREPAPNQSEINARGREMAKAALAAARDKRAGGDRP